MDNREIAGRLAEVARLLRNQGANEFRVRAYEQAAENIRNLNQPLSEIHTEEGVAGLDNLPGIGQSLARSIEHLLKSGRLPLLDRLRGDIQPERVFTSVADIGPELAKRIHEKLQIDTLGELEVAANDGRLAKVPGMGEKRIRAARESLAGRFRRTTKNERHAEIDPLNDPTIAELLEVDQQYRRLVQEDRLPRIAPRRFNPGGVAWLPILHTQRADRHYTVLFSNTARAHDLGTTHDWVLIIRDDREHQGQWTVITSQYGKLRGKRIVRGREDECAEYFRQQQSEQNAGVLFNGSGI